VGGGIVSVFQVLRTGHLTDGLSQLQQVEMGRWSGVLLGCVAAKNCHRRKRSANSVFGDWEQC